jgi:RNA polymerase sigma factor (sigma-70 family)
MENLEKHFPLVWSIARKYAAYRGENSPDDSEAFAEGLFFLAQAERTYDPERGASFTTWARTCIDYGLRSWVRLGRSRRLNQFDEYDDPADKPADSYQYDSVEKLARCVDLFDGRLRDIFEGRVNGLTWQQIGERCGCSKQAAEQLFQRRILPRLQEMFCVS